jgi:hypothetical protein
LFVFWIVLFEKKTDGTSLSPGPSIEPPADALTLLIPHGQQHEGDLIPLLQQVEMLYLRSTDETYTFKPCGLRLLLLTQ